MPPWKADICLDGLQSFAAWGMMCFLQHLKTLSYLRGSMERGDYFCIVCKIIAEFITQCVFPPPWCK